MRLVTGTLVFFVATLSTLAQGSSPRTPGRVGGSPNNPSVLRPHGGAEGISALALDASTVLTVDEQKQYQLARQAIPDLTVYDFFQIEYLSKTLHESHVETDPAQLAQRIASKKNHVVAALEQLGIRKTEAKKMYADANAVADTRTKQFSK